MHSTDALPLPPRPDVSQYRKLAKDLLAAARSDEPDAVRDWARGWYRNLWRLSRDVRDSEGGELGSPDPRNVENFARRIDAYWKGEPVQGMPPAQGSLAGAQHTIARVHGFGTWADLVRHIEENRQEDTQVGRFEAAADGIVRGDIAKVRRLLKEHPELATARSSRRHGATLLHYVSANGIEGYRQRTPPNIVEITKLLLDAGADVNASAECYGVNDTTIYLTATSMHPHNAGVMLELLQVLLDAGADIDRNDDGWTIVRSCLANGQGEAAVWLAEHGADLDLEEAAGVGRVEDVKRFVGEDGTLRNGATPKQLGAGFAWAAGYGHTDVVKLLLDRGVDPTVVGEDGGTPLHWAAYSGNRELVELLLARGVPANTREKVHGGTPLDWAIYSWASSDPSEASDETYRVVAALARAGAELNPAWRDDGSPAWTRVKSDPTMLAALEGRLAE